MSSTCVARPACADDLAREIRPGHVGRAREMISARLRRRPRASSRAMQAAPPQWRQPASARRPGQRPPSGCRASAQAQHGLHEIAAMRREDPGRAQDGKARRPRHARLFARKLRPAIGTQAAPVGSSGARGASPRRQRRNRSRYAGTAGPVAAAPAPLRRGRRRSPPCATASSPSALSTAVQAAALITTSASMPRRCRGTGCGSARSASARDRKRRHPGRSRRSSRATWPVAPKTSILMP